MQAPALATPARLNSSVMTALKRKSGVPPPPYSAGAAMPRNPFSPALRNIALSTTPARSHVVVVGLDLLLDEGGEAFPEQLVGVVEQGALHKVLLGARPGYPPAKLYGPACHFETPETGVKAPESWRIPQLFLVLRPGIAAKLPNIGLDGRLAKGPPMSVIEAVQIPAANPGRDRCRMAMRRKPRAALMACIG